MIRLPSVSIIVPVYNVEPYLRRCIDSILAQTYTDFELILVDDGSPDDCGEICDEYALTDPRIKVIHKTNGGLASARNAGLDIAAGEFVLFCDSDDYVGSDWCWHMLDAAAGHKGKLVFGGMTTVHSKEEVSFRPSTENYHSGEYSISDFFTENLPGFACSGIFDMLVIRENALRFPLDVIVEDLPFVLEYLKHADGLFFCGYSEYYYFQNDRETLSSKYYVDGYKKYREKYDGIQKFVEERIPDFDRASVKQAVATKYLYNFLHSLDNTFDKRNPTGFLQKMKYNRKVVRSWEFQDCLAYADPSGEDSRYLWFLKHRMYFSGWSLVQLGKMKQKWRRHK